MKTKNINFVNFLLVFWSCVQNEKLRAAKSCLPDMRYCYSVIDKKHTYEESMQACKEHGGELSSYNEKFDYKYELFKILSFTQIENIFTHLWFKYAYVIPELYNSGYYNGNITKHLTSKFPFCRFHQNKISITASIYGSGPIIEDNDLVVYYSERTVSKSVSDRDSGFEKEKTDDFVEFSCEAYASPPPEYTWFYKDPSQENWEEINIFKHNHKYAIINDKLLIYDANSDVDSGKFRCIAKNQYGSATNENYRIFFSYLLDFPKTIRDPLHVREHDYLNVPCNAPKHSPEITYMWSKQINGKRLFLRPHLNPHIFISKNGKLFFSSVNREDQANYTCFVKLNLKDKLVFQGKISRPIEVFVDKAVSFIKEPVIALGFPNIYPKNPKLNDDIIIECIAYGRIPLKYGWSKVNGELPKNRYRLTDNDRVLHINSIELFDSGYYRCRVERINGRSTYGDVLVNINVQPIFTLEINDQFLPEGSQFNWKCEAIGQDVIYTWYHNAKLIQTDKNCLMKLQNFSSRHTGIYRTCAENSHGKVCISAELRLINLTKYTYHDIRYEGIGSKKNIYDLCEISAMERGLINVHNVGGVIKNIEIGNNFNQTLPISQKYQCLFNNFYESFVVNYETIKIDKPIISKPYSDVVVNAGDNVTLQCQVSTPPILDVAYNWFYYDKKIEFERYYTRYDRFYIINDERYDRLHGFDNTLKINRVSHRSSGQYTCVTYFGLFMDSLRASTNLQVKDKPFCPYGVKIGGVGSTVAEIKWRMGNDGGYSVDYFTIDLTIDGGIKWYFKKNVTASITNVFKNLITELEPNTSYNFRVDAVNKLGSSNNCEKSEMIVTASASPEGVVPLIYGGGGKEGTLVIKWIPPKIGEFKYILYYKQENIKDDTWNEVRIENSKSTKYVVTVGKTNSYKPYMVAISVFNEHGIGPKSKKFKIMSSEYFPTGIPQTTVATQLNSTSLLVFWKEPKEQQDKNSNYSIGYRINYWRTKTENEYVALFLIVHNQLNGTIVGLDSNTLYSVNIQVFNSAGYSSKSNTYEERTLRKAPQYQPTNVMIQLIPTNKVKVIWRGVSTKLDEEPLKGYTIRMWREYTDYEIAIDIDVRKQTSYVLNAITPNVMYNLRVFAYSRGGQGQMSYPVSKFRIIDSSASFIKYTFTIYMSLLLIL